MKAFAIAAMLAIMMLGPVAANSQSQTGAPSPYPVTQGKAYKFEKVAEGVYYATGGMGANIPVIVNEDDVMLVDDATTPTAARALLEDLKLITNKPVRYVVNTHFHYDHTGGNSVFPADVQIMAQEYVRTAISTFNVLEREPYKTSQGMRIPALIASLSRQIAKQSDPGRKAALEKELDDAQALRGQLSEIKPTPPNVTYTSKLVLHKGSREIQLLFLGRGHTAGDTVVFLPNERIVCTGDLMESRIAYLGDGFFDEWVTTLDALKKLHFALVLPGHGAPFSDKNLITAFQAYLTDITAQVASLRRQGVPPIDAAQRVDLTSHQKDFPQIQGSGAEPRGVRRIYDWMDQNGK